MNKISSETEEILILERKGEKNVAMNANTFISI